MLFYPCPPVTATLRVELIVNAPSSIEIPSVCTLFDGLIFAFTGSAPQLTLHVAVEGEGLCYLSVVCFFLDYRRECDIYNSSIYFHRLLSSDT